MKAGALQFIILGLIFGFIAVFLGLKSVSATYPTAYVATGTRLHADAAIYACGLISAVCFLTAGLVVIKQEKQ